ncbi:MAG: hypothetical protein ACRBCS_10935 [Cellvibrionaceae bacterium]
MSITNNDDSVSTKKIIISTALSLVVAGILLTTTILPAEFNIDPFGTGKLLGITGMSEEGPSVGALNKQDINYSNDRFKIVLASFESLEYKYRLEEGASMLFNWSATGNLLFDLHAEKDGEDPEEYSPSFDQRQSNAEKGSYTAPFSGIHGWYWENRSANEVTLELNTSGFYTKSTEFRANYKNDKVFK